jgi:ribonuclease-3 family protein
LERFYNADCDTERLSPLTLAFVGDAVFELFVRERIVCMGNRPVKALHNFSVKQVCAAAQAQFAKKLIPVLTNEEAEIMRRGRNAHTNHVPKNSDISDYHAATAFEVLFGHLYLNGDINRLRTLFKFICDET